MAASIFVVSGDTSQRERLIDVLSGAGYSASGASSFAEAKQMLRVSSADLLIAEERLGAFNGLHVIVLGRAIHPELKAIVMTPEPNRALEMDARQLNVDCVLETAGAAEWLESVSRVLDETPAFDELPVYAAATVH